MVPLNFTPERQTDRETDRLAVHEKRIKSKNKDMHNGFCILNWDKKYHLKNASQDQAEYKNTSCVNSPKCVCVCTADIKATRCVFLIPFKQSQAFQSAYSVIME